MSVLAAGKYYYIVKCAGDNGDHPSISTVVPDIDLFVATNQGYLSRERALLVARELAEKTPGNRYYVTETIAGFMTNEPTILAKDYMR